MWEYGCTCLCGHSVCRGQRQSPERTFSSFIMGFGDRTEVVRAAQKALLTTAAALCVLLRSPLHSRLPHSVYWHRGSSRVVAVSPVHCSSCCSASGCTLTAVPVKRILASLSQLILHQNPGSVFINFKNFTGTNSPSILVGFYMVCVILKHGRTKYGRHHFWLLWSLSFSRLNVPHSKEWIILQMTGLTCFLILKIYWPSILSVLDHSWNEGCRINITDKYVYKEWRLWHLYHLGDEILGGDDGLYVSLTHMYLMSNDRP